MLTNTGMKILKSSEISAFGGINFVFDYLDQIEIDKIFTRHLPEFQTQSTYSWKDVTYSLLSIYLCGGDCVEDIHTHLKGHFKNNPYVNIPSPDTVLRRLCQLSMENNECQTKRGDVTHVYNTNSNLEDLNISVLKKLGCFKQKELTLDYDNTIIFNEKSDSKMTYKRDYGYQPGVCTINEEQILYIENRNGNSDAKSFQDATLARIFDLLDRNKIRKVDHFRADAASYQYDVINLLNKHVKWFYIGCRNSYIEKYFFQITNWENYKDTAEGTMEIGEIKITPFVEHIRKERGMPKEYRLVVKRKLKEDGQMNLFTQDAYEYRAILTNNLHYSKFEIADFYNHRGNMEKQFDILKNDFGWNHMPFSNIENNTVFLYFMAIFRNIYAKLIACFSQRFKYLKPTFRVKKFLFRFIILPAKWVYKARQNHLRVYGKINFCT
jgi:hypothetical protein